MSSKSFKVSRGELERIIQICENIEKRGLDPFTVNVRALLEKLRKLLEEGGDLEHYILDAETMYRIATLIALQHKWLRERAQSLFIDAQMVQTRLMALDNKSIARAFLKAWRPIISLEQITLHRLKQGIEHFLSLPPRAGGRGMGWKISQREIEHVRGSLELEEELSEKLEQLHRELTQRYELEGEIDYWEFVRGKSFEETFERAYLLSFLITNGYVDIRRNPLKGELKLVPRREKSERKRPSSLVITLRGWGEHE